MGFRDSNNFSTSTISIEKRHSIINEYLSSSLSRAEIWKKYTGRDAEHGDLLKWMKKLGYEDKPKKSSIFVSQPIEILPQEQLNISNLSKEDLQKELVKLKKLLEEAQIKAEGYNLMIDYAEKEFKIPIRKKPNTK